MFTKDGITTSFRWYPYNHITVCELTKDVFSGPWTGIARLNPNDTNNTYEAQNIALHRALIHSTIDTHSALRFLNAWRADYKAKHPDKPAPAPKKWKCPEGRYRLGQNEIIQAGDVFHWSAAPKSEPLLYGEDTEVSEESIGMSVNEFMESIPITRALPKPEPTPRFRIPEGWRKLGDKETMQVSDKVCWTLGANHIKSELLSSSGFVGKPAIFAKQNLHDDNNDAYVIRKLPEHAPQPETPKPTCQIPEGWYRITDMNDKVCEGDRLLWISLIFRSITSDIKLKESAGKTVRQTLHKLNWSNDLDTCIIRRIPEGAKFIHGKLMRRLNDGEKLTLGDYGVNKPPRDFGAWEVTGLCGCIVSYATAHKDMKGFYRPIQKG